MNQETCPHCGAALDGKYGVDPIVRSYKCGTRTETYREYGTNKDASSYCYQRQLAQKDAEIDRLKKAVIDVREACAVICDNEAFYFAKLALRPDESARKAAAVAKGLAATIRVGGEVK